MGRLLSFTIGSYWPRAAGPSFLGVGYPQCPYSREEWLLELSYSDRLSFKAIR